LYQGVSRFSRLLPDQVAPAPLSETMKPKAGLATTWVQGKGGRCSGARRMTYARPSAVKPPKPLSQVSGSPAATSPERSPVAAGR
jgi:hypothetical protein